MCRSGNTFTSSLDFRKDRIGRGGPDERLRVGVGSPHLLIDFLHACARRDGRSAVSGQLIRWKRNDRIREARRDQEHKHQTV